MSKRATIGTHGGVDLLDREDLAVDATPFDILKYEAIEVGAFNARDDDTLTNSIHDLTGKPFDVLGYVNQKYYVTGDQYMPSITFSRHYWSLNLLVDMLQAPITPHDNERTEKVIAKHRAFAESIGAKYLPIVGAATLEQIAAAL